MSSSRSSQNCTLSCPWKYTNMCAQNHLSAQALADRRLSLGVLCGMKQIYSPHGLPPCIVGDSLRWEAVEQETELTVMALVAA